MPIATLFWNRASLNPPPEKWIPAFGEGECRQNDVARPGMEQTFHALKRRFGQPDQMLYFAQGHFGAVAVSCDYGRAVLGQQRLGLVGELLAASRGRRGREDSNQHASDGGVDAGLEHGDPNDECDPGGDGGLSQAEPVGYHHDYY